MSAADPATGEGVAERETLINDIGRASAVARLAIKDEPVALGRSAVESIADHLIHRGYRLAAPSGEGAGTGCVHCLGVGRVIDVYGCDDEATRPGGYCHGQPTRAGAADTLRQAVEALLAEYVSHDEEQWTRPDWMEVAAHLRRVLDGSGQGGLGGGS